jgi:hypothetical protein
LLADELTNATRTATKANFFPSASDGLFSIHGNRMEWITCRFVMLCHSHRGILSRLNHLFSCYEQCKKYWVIWSTCILVLKFIKCNVSKPTYHANVVSTCRASSAQQGMLLLTPLYIVLSKAGYTPSCTYSAFHSAPRLGCTGPVGIHYDSVSDSTPKQVGQSDHTTSNMTQIDLSGTTLTQFIDSKQATPTAFDPCMLAGVPTMDFRDTPDL